MLDRFFSSISRVDADRVRFELNPAIIGDLSSYRLRTGFAIMDSREYAWPSPWRNMNNTGKYLIPNYGDPAFPETIGEFILLIQQRGDPQTNSVIFAIPGISEEKYAIAMAVCIINPDNYSLDDAISSDVILLPAPVN